MDEYELFEVFQFCEWIYFKVKTKYVRLKSLLTITKIKNNMNVVSDSLAIKFVDDFHIILPKVIDEALSNINYMDSEKVKARIKEMSVYYTLEQKPILGELMLHAYEILNGPEYPDKQTEKQAYILACSMELGISHFLFIDDIEDDSKLRCSKPCWHLLPNVGPLAMNDSNILRSFIHELFQQTFSQPVLLKLINYVNKMYFVTAIGQHMDAELANKRCYNDYTRENYFSVTLNKQIFIIASPIVFALFLVNKATDESIQHVHEICRDLAIVLQIQNDMVDLNCDGMKSCTDIPKAKCSWLAVKALEICNEEQRNVFEKYYGSWDPSHIQIIQKLYDDLKLKQLFVEERRSFHETFLKKVDALPPNSIPGTQFYRKLFNVIVSLRI